MKYLLALEVFENLSTHRCNLKQPIRGYLYEKNEVIDKQKDGNMRNYFSKKLHH